ncbi:hypothetical protein ACR6HW_05025 [Fusibacter sp. JL298sf-3]
MIIRIDEELKNAFFKQSPVVYNGMVYKNIMALSYKMTEKGLRVCLLLKDMKHHNSVTEALASRVSVL